MAHTGNGSGNGNGTATFDARATRQALEDATAYPILTESIDTGGTVQTTGLSGGGSGGGASGAPIGRIVDGAIRDVLAWRPRPDDSKAFVSALTQAFDLYDVEGHREWKWLPRSYAIDADLGAVTGAQASIYARARAFLDQVLPLLDGLTPLRPDFDQQDVDASRAIVKNGITELVAELGQEGGPRFARVNQLFSLLLGPQATRSVRPVPATGDNVGNQLGLLKQYFGMSRSFVKTIPEEENYTNFLIIVDGVQGLLSTWQNQRDSFDRKGDNVFLGTQAVLISRQLGVIAETVNDATVALDSVFLGAAERQVLELPLGDGAPIFLGELFSWINDFATDEGILLVREGGKDGVTTTFLPTVNELYKLARHAAAASYHGGPGLPKGFTTPRVQRILDDLMNQIREAVNLAKQLRDDRPVVTRIDPQTWHAPGSSIDPKDWTLPIKVHGLNFRDGSTIRLDRADRPHVSIEAADVQWHSDRRLNATLHLLHQDVPSSWHVIVIDPDGVEERMKGLFKILPPDSSSPTPPTPPTTPPPPPALLELSQAQAYSGDALDSIAIYGENLNSVTSVWFDTYKMGFASRRPGQLNVSFPSNQVPMASAPSQALAVEYTTDDSPEPKQTSLQFTVLLPPQIENVSWVTDGKSTGLTIQGEALGQTKKVEMSLTYDTGGESYTITPGAPSVKVVTPQGQTEPEVIAQFGLTFLSSVGPITRVHLIVNTVNDDRRSSKGFVVEKEGDEVAPLLAALAANDSATGDGGAGASTGGGGNSPSALPAPHAPAGKAGHGKPHTKR